MSQTDISGSAFDLLSRSDMLPHTQLEDDLLIMPAEGGGLLLPDLRETAGRWINLSLTVEEDHAQAFEFRFYAEGDAPRVIVRFGVMPRWQAHFALDMNWLDGHCLFPGHRVGTQKVVCHGSRISLPEIRRTEFVSMASAKAVHVRLASLRREDAPCPATELRSEPLIDAFGQYIPKDWPGKIRSLDELRQSLTREAEAVPAWPFPNWTVWGGDANRKLKEGTGFFSSVRKDGRWYLTDPSGCAFFSMGPDCAAARCDARIDGLEPVLAELPDQSQPEHAALYEPLSRVFGETERPGGQMFSYERWNLLRVFGDRWADVWPSMVVSQLMRMGLNTLGNWSDPNLFGRMPYVTSLPEFPSTAHRIFRDFPDVLSEEYRGNARRCA